MIDILEQVCCRLSELFKLRLNEINEDVYRREPWNCISFVKHNGFLNVAVRVISGCFVVDELFVQAVEVKFDLSSPR